MTRSRAVVWIRSRDAELFTFGKAHLARRGQLGAT